MKRDLKNKIITIDQTCAIKNLLKRFNVEDCKKVKNPIEKNLCLSKSVDENLKTTI